MVASFNCGHIFQDWLLFEENIFTAKLKHTKSNVTFITDEMLSHIENAYKIILCYNIVSFFFYHNAAILDID